LQCGIDDARRDEQRLAGRPGFAVARPAIFVYAAALPARPAFPDMTGLLADPWFFAAAVPAVILVGLSKGGFGGGVGFLGVPLMALVIPPVQAAAILLPIMVVMDMVALWSWRGKWDRRTLAAMLPASLVGIGIGWLTASMITADAVRFIIGLVAISFVARWLWGLGRHGPSHAASPNPRLAAFWGVVSGFTSFVGHLGGPPFQMYVLPLRLDPRIFTGTSVIFFAVTNAVKLVPYAALGQLDAANMTSSLALAPLAPLATLAGAWLVRRMRPEIFYPFTYATMLLIALKLVHDGLSDLAR
jgi:uncharacterized membrane protein YfcA